MRCSRWVAFVVLLAAPSLADAQGTVEDAVGGECDTRGVKGLSRQLLNYQKCTSIEEGDLITFFPHPNITLEVDEPLGSGPTYCDLTSSAVCDSRVNAFLMESAHSALIAAANSIPPERGTPLQINSGFRTAVDQYVLLRSLERGLPGCTRVAAPGGSNHQSGLAIDIQNGDEIVIDAIAATEDTAAVPARTWRWVLEAHGCRWLGPTDVPHYDCPGTALAGRESVEAFQRLWNLNNPEEPIAEDGGWGAATRRAMERSPAAGFPLDGCNPCPQHCDGDTLTLPDCRTIVCTDGCVEDRFEAQCEDTPEPDYIDPWLRNRIRENAKVPRPRPPRKIEAPDERTRRAVLEEGCSVDAMSASSVAPFAFIAVMLFRRRR